MFRVQRERREKISDSLGNDANSMKVKDRFCELIPKSIELKKRKKMLL